MQPESSKDPGGISIQKLKEKLQIPKSHHLLECSCFQDRQYIGSKD